MTILHAYVVFTALLGAALWTSSPLLTARERLRVVLLAFAFAFLAVFYSNLNLRRP